jgi:hypothetical protein
MNVNISFAKVIVMVVPKNINSLDFVTNGNLSSDAKEMSEKHLNDPA